MSKSKPISLEQIANVVADIENLDFEAKIKRFDVIFEDQPAVLGAIVQLHTLGVDSQEQEHALHILLVLYECFTQHVPGLPKITEEMVQSSFDSNATMLRFYDQETPEEATRLHRLSTRKHPEQNVLAFVVGYLTEKLPNYSRENELVLNACTAVMDAFIKAKQLPKSRSVDGNAAGRVSRPKRKSRRQRRLQ